MTFPVEFISFLSNKLGFLNAQNDLGGFKNFVTIDFLEFKSDLDSPDPIKAEAARAELYSGTANMLSFIDSMRSLANLQEQKGPGSINLDCSKSQVSPAAIRQKLQAAIASAQG